MNRVGGLSLLLEFLKRLRGNSVQLRHRRDSCSEIPGRRGIFLERRREHARPEGFGQQQNVARLHAYIAPNPLRMNQTRDRIAKLNVVVSNRVPADDAEERCRGGRGSPSSYRVD